MILPWWKTVSYENLTPLARRSLPFARGKTPDRARPSSRVGKAVGRGGFGVTPFPAPGTLPGAAARPFPRAPRFSAPSPQLPCRAVFLTPRLASPLFPHTREVDAARFCPILNVPRPPFLAERFRLKKHPHRERRRHFDRNHRSRARRQRASALSGRSS